jgi:hypothetical protein
MGAVVVTTSAALTLAVITPAAFSALVSVTVTEAPGAAAAGWATSTVSLVVTASLAAMAEASTAMGSLAGASAAGAAGCAAPEPPAKNNGGSGVALQLVNASTPATSRTTSNTRLDFFRFFIAFPLGTISVSQRVTINPQHPRYA